MKRLADLKNMSDSKVRIIFSLTPLYYPPHTPLQYHACITAIEDNKKLKRKSNVFVSSTARNFGKALRMKKHG